GIGSWLAETTCAVDGTGHCAALHGRSTHAFLAGTWRGAVRRDLPGPGDCRLMWIYLLVLAIPLGMSFQAPRRRNRQMVLVAYYLLLWLFVGLRYEVGPDWFGYTNIYEATISQDW